MNIKFCFILLNFIIIEWFIIKGNDEVYYDCWKSNPNITEWMEKMNFRQYHELGMILFLFMLAESF